MKTWGNPARGDKSQLAPLLFEQGALPSGEELAEIVRRYNEDGYVLLYSTVLEDKIAFVRGADGVQRIPGGYVPYTGDELVELYGPGVSPVKHDTLRLIHEAKRYGAVITGVEKIAIRT